MSQFKVFAKVGDSHFMNEWQRMDVTAYFETDAEVTVAELLESTETDLYLVKKLAMETGKALVNINNILTETQTAYYLEFVSTSGIIYMGLSEIPERWIPYSYPYYLLYDRIKDESLKAVRHDRMEPLVHLPCFTTSYSTSVQMYHYAEDKVNVE